MSYTVVRRARRTEKERERGCMRQREGGEGRKERNGTPWRRKERRLKRASEKARRERRKSNGDGR